ncbi:FadR/GntR family transcriptional regulator [Pelagibaculum spongiae]|uniref:HTH gntR-type domain-containing protein n=1 Tax=Pelagibaculum spongiae TaxID=2080658 RepID=A0A2V1GSK0_9GAMM|nr:FadR/GntR family transcriptional regulator [Pelagibaculum spongiae]PVZ68369.1 hypothetical protein DC094_13890 [Pelagibaculum spongiae]
MPDLLQRLPELVMKSLEQKIFEGDWPPGTRLPPERQLSKDMDVSRNSLRDAIQRLVSRGLLETRQGSGTRVVEHPETSYQGKMEDLLISCPSLHKNTLDFRLLLESEAVKLATLYATEAQKTELVELAIALDKTFDNIDIEKDQQFHLKIAEYSGNPLIFHSLKQLGNLLTESIIDNTSALFARPEVLRHHRKRHLPIARAIQFGHCQRAAEAIKDHFVLFQDLLRDKQTGKYE